MEIIVLYVVPVLILLLIVATFLALEQSREEKRVEREYEDYVQQWANRAEVLRQFRNTSKPVGGRTYYESSPSVPSTPTETYDIFSNPVTHHHHTPSVDHSSHHGVCSDHHSTNDHSSSHCTDHGGHSWSD